MGERPDRKHVHVHLRGRLGNQMFQYAAGRALATRLDANLTLVTPYFGPDGRFRTDLDPFALDTAVVARWPRHPRHIHWKPLRWAVARLGDHRFRCKLPTFQEPHFHVTDRFFAIADSCCLAGYWQSWRYFDAIADGIRADLDLGRFAGPAIADALANIATQPTAAVHVRRSDYAGDSSTFHLSGRDYYDRARQALDGMGEGLRYLIFSDEPMVAQALLSDWPDCTFVDGHTPYQDMLLFSRCRHYVIANSTFSWWSAWLGATAESRVVAPRQWFSRERQSTMNIRDLYPADWIVI
jgi:hypothetical protein